MYHACILVYFPNITHHYTTIYTFMLKTCRRLIYICALKKIAYKRSFFFLQIELSSMGRSNAIVCIVHSASILYYTYCIQNEHADFKYKIALIRHIGNTRRVHDLLLLLLIRPNFAYLRTGFNFYLFPNASLTHVRARRSRKGFCSYESTQLNKF